MSREGRAERGVRAERGELFGPYRLEELIGRGGMGEVYRAYDTRRNRVVAIKILPPALATPQFEARFRQESQLVARLSAPHIIPIHDFGEIDGRLFLDMRLVRGVDLETVLEGGPLSPSRAVEMISQVAGALDAAHADGLVHRDVKPSNVLYVGDPRQRWADADEPDFVYLVDFGIARNVAAGGSLTATGHAVGTLGYMAPERFSGAATDRRADVYALAATLYEALTGRPAFAGDELAQLMFAHLHRMPPPVSSIDTTLSPALDEVLARGLAKDPASRYATAGRLAEAARAALRGAQPRNPTRPLPSGGEPGVGAQPARRAATPGMDPTGPVRLADLPAAALPAADRTAPHPGTPTPGTPTPGPPGPRRLLQVAGAVVGAVALLAAGVVGVRELVDAGASARSTGLSSCATTPLTCNGADPAALRAGGEVTVAVESTVASWNVAAPDGTLGPTPWAMGSVLPYTFTVAPDYTRTLNTDLLAGAEQTSPTTVVYTIKPAARWNDGTPVGADDFAFTWRTRNGKDCPTCFGDPTGYDQISAVTGAPTPDGGSTVVVSFAAPYPDWPTLFASTSPLYPAHLAAAHGDLSTPAGLGAAYDWLGATVPTYSAGPMVVQSWQPDTALVLARNPRWYGRPARLDRVVLRVVPDPEDQVRALRAGQVQVIAPFARAGLADQLTGAAGVEVVRGASLAWERIELNLRTPSLREPALRQALFTAIDLGRVRGIGTAAFGDAEPLGSHFFVPGEPGYRDLLTGTGQGTGDLAAARGLLTAAGYTGVGSTLVGPDGVPVPPLRGVYAAVNPARQQVAAYVTETARGLGLTVTAGTIDIGDYTGTLTGGRFDLLYSGWAFSSARITDASTSWTTGAAANYTGYSNPQVDRLLAGATADADAAGDLIGQADALITRDAVALPLFRRSTVLAVRTELANVRDNGTVGPLYNVTDWGLRD